jgi:hypothetical protein
MPTAALPGGPPARSSTPFARACPAASTPRCSGAATDRPLRWSTPATPSWTAQVRGAVVTFVDITERKRCRRGAAEGQGRTGTARGRAHARAVGRAGPVARAGRLREKRARGRAHPHCARGARRAGQPAGGAEDGRELAGQAPGRTAGAKLEAARTCAAHARQMPEHEPPDRDAVDNVGRIITDLRPSILDHQGLWAALEWQAQEFVQSAELALDWHMDVPSGAALPEARSHGGVPHLPGNAEQRGRHAQASPSCAHRRRLRGCWHSRCKTTAWRAPAQAFEAAMPTA